MPDFCAFTLSADRPPRFEGVLFFPRISVAAIVSAPPAARMRAPGLVPSTAFTLTRGTPRYHFTAQPTAFVKLHQPATSRFPQTAQIARPPLSTGWRSGRPVRLHRTRRVARGPRGISSEGRIGPKQERHVRTFIKKTWNGRQRREGRKFWSRHCHSVPVASAKFEISHGYHQGIP